MAKSEIIYVIVIVSSLQFKLVNEILQLTNYDPVFFKMCLVIQYTLRNRDTAIIHIAILIM